MKIEDCDGPCAQKIKELDWPRTRMGGTETWPRILKLVLGMMLRSSAPKLIIWGDDLVTFYNDAMMNMFGRSGTAGIGACFRDLRPEVWPLIADCVNLARSGKPCGTSELVLPSDGNGEAFYHLCYTPVPDDKGVPRGVLIDVYNTTHARRAERTLRDENSWLNRLFAEAPVFIAYGSGRECKLEYTNRAFEDLHDNRRLVGLTVDEAAPEIERQGFRQIIHEVFDSGEPFIGTDMKLEIDRSDGQRSIHYLDFMYQPVRDDDDIVIGILCTGYDVTERHRAQMEAERLRHQVLHASRINAMGTMAMTVAHELNQPLAAAANYLAAAQVLSQGSAGLAPVLKGAEAEILRAGDVVRRIRSVVQSGKAERTLVSIKRAHDRAVMLLTAAGVRDLASVVNPASGATHVLADEIQLEQIFTNLIRNAAEATRDVLPKKIEVSSVAGTRGRILITVRDFGAGLPEDRLDDPFDQLGTSTVGGLGLGLALTRTLVEANGGSISAANATDGGACFTIELDGGM